MSDYEEWCRDAPDDYAELDSLPHEWQDRLMAYEQFVSDCESLIELALQEGRPIDPLVLRARIAARLGAPDVPMYDDAGPLSDDIPF